MHTVKRNIDQNHYTPSLIEIQLKSFESLFNNHNLQIIFDFVSDDTAKLQFINQYGYKDFLPSYLNQFRIKCVENINTEESSIDSFHKNFGYEKLVGFLLHEKLAKSLKLKSYIRKINNNNSNNSEEAETIQINKESYCVYFIKVNEEIRSEVFVANIIPLVDNNIINIESNIISPYISNENFCNTIATFNNLSNGEKFHYYYPNNLSYYRIKLDKIHDINILI